MTNVTFAEKARAYLEAKENVERLKAEILAEMLERLSSDEVLETYDDGKELAVTYDDCVIKEITDMTQVKADYKALGKPIPKVESMSTKLTVKIRKTKNK